ncbi:DUF4942 domain-containing protein [Salmonella enterica]|jgi:hypothetical protein|uniref:DUF4942 domain-containing protein n=1 Tax=Salmonella senftenberg TaxID=28150 RepID=A0A3V2HZ07_SALSE|nr:MULTISPECIES: DUF4942 domain-containing protein [Enterobacterales]ECC3098676.1 DUF4942 domain-containing protein [Salmonella enterica subsp. enterica]EDB5583795.1 DUF4942 domain-containing protein [Salmonella enterica subsp. enterica serovar Schwarzengrund]EDB5626156.1 DUF4942 domain-containing protein [Salmonella enterica subsp. enterica serovar Kentucky]EDX5041745.1 DUF4942 domain-containing protein [Salmonella enterica subsp. enterica serovar Westhampton]EDX7478317.1 DUF4942 domain-conta
MQTTSPDPQVLTGHSELIPSTSIERIVTGRDAALEQIRQLIAQLNAISQLTDSIGGGIARDWMMRQGYAYDCWLTETPEKAMKAITRHLDRSIWRDLMQKSGMLALMDAQAREQWYNSLEQEDIPTISTDNILTTFELLHCDKQVVFERGVINVFRGLSWDYKTNSPCKFGKKIIVTGLVRHKPWGFGLNWGRQRDQLVDLERMLHVLNGKPIPDNRTDIASRLSEHIRQHPHDQQFEDEMMSIRYFQKGTCHIIFRCMELVEKMNDIVARHYPGMLAAR